MRAPLTDVWPFKKVLLQPLERIASDTPTWGWGAAWLGAGWQWLQGDAFSALLGIIIVVGVADFYYGVKSAKLHGRFNPTLAQRGVHGKMSGIVLLLAVRLFEGWTAGYAIVDSEGAVATALGIALLSVDLQSIAHHRESFGATPIPILSAVLAWMQRVSTGPTLHAPPPPRDEDDDETSGGPDAPE